MKERDAKDYAIEFGGYLATGAERYMATVNAHAMTPSVQNTTAMSEAYQRLQSDIYEFRKRRDRATPWRERI